MLTDLVVIHPGAAHGIYGSELADSLVAVEPPIWGRIIAGYVRDRGFSVKIIDAEAQRLSPREVAKVVWGERPRLVCIAVYGHQPSASTQQMTGARATAEAVREQYSCPIIMVGGHVSALPARTLEEEPIDYACLGEGPQTIVGLLDGDPDEAQIPGLVWRDDTGTIRINNPAPLIGMHELHGNAWDLLPIHLYKAHNWQCFGDLSSRKPYASIHTSLGCPYKCSFCCINAPFGSNQYRMRDAYAVVAEIAHLNREYGVSTFKIVDEMFVLNERHYTAIAEGLVEYWQRHRWNESPFNIWAYARVDTVKPDKLALLRKAGIRWLALGIESASAYVRDGAQKRLREDDIAGVVRAIQGAGINVIGNYIFGLPDDDLDSMQQTLDLALELNTEFANFYSAMAYPGSPLYTEALAKGWALPTTWRGYSQHNDDCRPLDTAHVSAADVLRFRDRAFELYFTNPMYLSMVERKFGPATLEHVRQMTTYRLKRKLLDPEAAEAAE